MFDSIFAFATALKEAEKYVNLYDSKVSCSEDRPLEVGKALPSYLEKVDCLIKILIYQLFLINSKIFLGIC